MTSSLFATTVLASFFVVALPHILPCPAPRVAFADGEMSDGKRRRRKRPEVTETKDGYVQFQPERDEADDKAKAVVSARECPVPKPTGVLGGILGFNKENGDEPESRPDR